MQIGGRPLRFLIAGGLNTLFGLSIYPLLMWTVPGLDKRYMLALFFSQVISLSFAFLTYKIGVFSTRGTNVFREFATFSSFYVFNYAVNWLALPFLVEVGGISPIIAQLGFTLALIVGSWFWHSRVTFREKGKA